MEKQQNAEHGHGESEMEYRLGPAQAGGLESL